MKKIKVLIPDIVTYPKGNGWTTHRWELIQNLSKFENDLYVISRENIEISNVYVYHIKKKNKFSFIYSIFKIIKKGQFDIIYTRNIYMGFLILMVKKFYDFKLILELNGLTVEDSKVNEYKNKIFTEIIIRLEFFVAKHADAVIGVTSGIRDILIENGISRNKINVVSNGANVDLFKPFHDDTEFKKIRNLYGIPKDSKIVLFVGHINEWHGIDYLVRCSKKILNKIPNTCFLIVGDGDAKEKNIKLAHKLSVHDNFHFIGKIPYDEVPKIINMSDICVAPFIYQRNNSLGISPVKMYEYMACGKAVVVSNIKGVSELINESGAGITVKSEDINELAVGIMSLLKNENLRTQLGYKGRDYVEKHYSWKCTAQKISDIFKEMTRI